MCKNAASTVAALMGAIEPTLVNLLTALNIASTTQGQAAITAYNEALQAVENWKPGTTSQDVIQVIDAFVAVFNTLPIPDDAKGLADIISAGVVAVIGVLTGNSPASIPPADETNATPEEIQAAHQAAAAHDTEQKIHVLVPGFKRAIFTAPAHQYKNAWNKGVETAEKSNPKYAVLKVA